MDALNRTNTGKPPKGIHSYDNDENTLKITIFKKCSPFITHENVNSDDSWFFEPKTHKFKLLKKINSILTAARNETDSLDGINKTINELDEIDLQNESILNCKKHKKVKLNAKKYLIAAITSKIILNFCSNKQEII